MEILVLVIHVLAALSVIGLVLLQHGKGADVGAAFGGGASGSVFGSAGSANFLSRATAILAVVFFLSSLGLTYLSARRTEHKGVMATPAAPTKSVPSDVPVPSTPAGQAAPTVPATPSESGSKAGEVPK
ncbi:MAG: preprotein translocase subunit SecG [Betaproteobacteria bacterium RIFCSPLOWO2_12_FULL_62_58]|nr:MAG: preprotein translocase subunit SecG [Betaproteobacteria bacterium RIFCSPLOWO2_02_FULL_62_79]OGA50497.1 MAG: preprotein translocase subunit SecG [Betaproteobacteria bacterium RIFCSPLOWO2_12_FULL_62_58]